MGIQIKIVTMFVLCLFFGYAHADAFVCVDKHGKKVFLTESCEKNGMTVGTHDFTVASGQSINAVVIENLSIEEIAKRREILKAQSQKGPWDFRAGELKISPIILVFLLMSIFGMVFILGYQIVVYFKNHQRKLKWSNEVEFISPTK